MNNKIADDMKAAVIRLYLKGESRNDTAEISQIGAGTVSNIINEWKHSLSNPDADSLRELSINLKRFGMDASQCAVGFRAAMIMKKVGVNEEEIESFLTQVISYCLQYSILPQQIACNVKPLVELSKSVPLDNIPSFIEQKENQVNAVNQKIEELQKIKKDLSIEISSLKELKDVALQQENMTYSELASYSKSKEKLAHCGLSLEQDIPKLAQLITNMEKHGYDPSGILSEYFDLQSIRAKRDEIERQITMLERRKLILEHDCAELQDEESKHFQTLIAYNQLKSIGFGLQELKILKYTITEVAKAQNVGEESAVTAFFQKLKNGLDIEYSGHNNKVSFNPSTWPFFGAVVGGSSDQKQNKEKVRYQEHEPDNPAVSFSKTLAFPAWWYLLQGQQRLQLEPSTSTPRSPVPPITSLPRVTPDIIKNVNLEFKRHLENIKQTKIDYYNEHTNVDTGSVHKYNPREAILDY